ncbi:MAG: hypothetical protein WCW35_11215 [Bacteroidota bacterium]
MKDSPISANILILCVLLFTSISCTDTSAGSGTGGSGSSNAFLFHVIVKDSVGNPVQGLRISACSDLSPAGMYKQQNGKNASGTASQAVITYALADTYRVSLSVFELDGSTIALPVQNIILLPGMYAVSVNVNNSSAGTRVYNAVLSAVDTASRSEQFRDSIYITLWQQDVGLSVLGYTTEKGICESNDSLSFPHLFKLPPMIRTDATGPDSIGIFSLPETYVITLTDSLTNQAQSYIRTVDKGRNEFQLTWNPPGTGISAAQYHRNSRLATAADTTIPSGAPTVTKLYQNYPNPFN